MERYPTPTFARILGRIGGREPYTFRARRSGGNNRSYHVTWRGGAAFLKVYFHHPGDARDRLGAEFDFLQFAWHSGIRVIPKPLARDAKARLGVYEYISGKPLHSGQVTDKALHEALYFYQALNANTDTRTAARLPMASEACFSLGDHLMCVDHRVQRLRRLRSGASAVTRKAVEFIDKDLGPAWEALKQSLPLEARRAGIDWQARLAKENRCLSPSDFGFHNALATAKGLRFVDFEYAGWDDPAKMVCDFFLQPKIPVPKNYFKTVIARVIEAARDPESLQRRIRLLLPVYRLKWCCIMLNEFLPVGSRRRRFARNPLDPENQKRRQLMKARQFLWPT